MIPNAALVAMLITVGIKLAHPKEFINTLKIGREQLAIFLVTIFFTLFEDLLVGIAAGILLKVIMHALNGTPISSFFKAPTLVSFTGNRYLVEIDKAAIFSNYLGIKRKLEEIPAGFDVTIDLKNTKLVDHSVMENLHHFQHYYEENGVTVKIIGLENHIPASSHELASRKLIGTGQVYYTQVGYLMRNDLLGSSGTLQPYAQLIVSDFDRVANPFTVYDVGVNWLQVGHRPKVSLDYQSRAILAQGTGEKLEKNTGDPRKGMLVMQYQFAF